MTSLNKVSRLTSVWMPWEDMLFHFIAGSVRGQHEANPASPFFIWQNVMTPCPWAYIYAWPLIWILSFFLQDFLRSLLLLLSTQTQVSITGGVCLRRGGGNKQCFRRSSRILQESWVWYLASGESTEASSKVWRVQLLTKCAEDNTRIKYVILYNSFCLFVELTVFLCLYVCLLSCPSVHRKKVLNHRYCISASTATKHVSVF